MTRTRNEKQAVTIFRNLYPVKLSVAKEIIQMAKTDGTYSTYDNSVTVRYENGWFVFS